MPPSCETASSRWRKCRAGGGWLQRLPSLRLPWESGGFPCFCGGQGRRGLSLVLALSKSSAANIPSRSPLAAGEARGAYVGWRPGGLGCVVRGSDNRRGGQQSARARRRASPAKQPNVRGRQRQREQAPGLEPFSSCRCISSSINSTNSSSHDDADGGGRCGLYPSGRRRCVYDGAERHKIVGKGDPTLLARCLAEATSALRWPSWGSASPNHGTSPNGAEGSRDGAAGGTGRRT